METPMSYSRCLINHPVLMCSQGDGKFPSNADHFHKRESQTGIGLNVILDLPRQDIMKSDGDGTPVSHNLGQDTQRTIRGAEGYIGEDHQLELHQGYSHLIIHISSRALAPETESLPHPVTSPLTREDFHIVLNRENLLPLRVHAVHGHQAGQRHPRFEELNDRPLQEPLLWHWSRTQTTLPTLRLELPMQLPDFRL